MTVSLDVLQTHLDYTAWASGKLVSCASALSPEALTRDFGTADRCVLGTLVHIYAADRIWLGRLRGNPPARFIDAEKDMHLSVLQSDWPALHKQWNEWFAAQTADSVGSVCRYQDLKGDSFANPIWQILLHLVNHGTHHRGQVSGFLRAMGQTPPPLDLMAYYRELSRG